MSKRSDISDIEVVLACKRAHEMYGPFASELLMEKFQAPEKVVMSAMERADDRGYIEWGVSLRSAWPTAKGLALLDLPSIHESLMRDLAGALNAAEYRLLKNALCDHLNREPQLGDWAKCIMSFRQDRPNEYVFSYNGEELGRMIREMKFGGVQTTFTEISVTWVPSIRKSTVAPNFPSQKV